MAKLADAHALGACEATRGGSNPPTRTKKQTPLVGVLFFLFDLGFEP